MSRTITSDSHSSVSRKWSRESCTTFGAKDKSAKGSLSNEALQRQAAERLAEDIFDVNETFGEDQESPSDSSNKNIRRNVLKQNPSTLAEDVGPSSILIAKEIQGVPFCKPLRVLFDSGLTSNFLFQTSLPKGARPQALPSKRTIGLLKGDATIDSMVTLNDVELTELSRSKHIKTVPCYVVSGECRYDMIIGRHTLRQLGIRLDFKTETVHWGETVSPMVPILPRENLTRFRQVQQQFLASIDPMDPSLDPQGLAIDESFMTSVEFKDSSPVYEEHDVDDISRQQKHLTAVQQRQLANLLRKFTRLFRGRLGSYPLPAPTCR